MDGTSNYWSAVTRSRLTRRHLLKTGAAVGVGAAALSLIGCGGGDSGGGSSASGLLYTPVDTTSKAVNGGTFGHVVSDIANFDTINGADSTAADMGMSRLTKYEVVKAPKLPEPLVSPDAAISWEVAPDGLTYTYKVRPNFKFDPRPPTNNRTMTAQDIKWSWDHFDAVNPQHANLSNKADPGGPITSVTAIDAMTVQMKLAFPYAPLNAMFGYSRHLSIFPVEAETKYDLRNDMRGTAAWRLKTFLPSARVEYVKNPDWYDADKVHFDGVNGFVVPEYAAALAQFVSGAIGFYTVNQEDVLRTKRDHPSLLMSQIEEYEQVGGKLRFSYLPNSPFLDARVRQAVSMLLDRDLIIQTFKNTKEFTDAGLTVPMRWNTSLGAGEDPFWLDPKDTKAFGENAKYFAYNPTAAKALLQAAGHNSPIEAPFLVTSYYGDEYLREGEVMHQMWEANGNFKMSVRDTDYRSDFRPNVRYGYDKHEGIAWQSSGEDYPDVDGLMSATWVSGKDRTGHVMQDGKVNTHMDDLLNKQRSETDVNKRIAIYKEFQQYAAQTMYTLLNAGDALGFQLAQPWLGNWNYFRSPSGGSPWNEARSFWWQDPSKKT